MKLDFCYITQYHIIMKTYTEQALERIRSFIREKDFSILGFARYAKVSASAIRNIHTDKYNGTITTVIKMEQSIPEDYTPKE